MPSRYPSGEERKLDILFFSSVGEGRTVDTHVGIISISSYGDSVIGYGEHVVEDIESQNRALGRTAFGG